MKTAPAHLAEAVPLLYDPEHVEALGAARRTYREHAHSLTRLRN
ncbi:MAG TPA: hypothetical protein VF576_12865 [Rubricoccaceae bacterium]